MARLYRPYIPIPVRLKVALRQLAATEPAMAKSMMTIADRSDGARLKAILYHLFDGRPYALDHDPALVNRRKRPSYDYDKRTDGVKAITLYTPDANDPRYLVYREAGAGSDHDIKTRVRGEHGQLSDLGLARKEKRRAKKLAAKKRRSKWQRRCGIASGAAKNLASTSTTTRSIHAASRNAIARPVTPSDENAKKRTSSWTGTAAGIKRKWPSRPFPKRAKQ